MGVDPEVAMSRPTRILFAVLGALVLGVGGLATARAATTDYTPG
jgi:hypothetical protein